MKTLILFTLTLLLSFSALAQDKRSERHEKIKALKVAFITEKLDLTKKEAQQFWPIYNAHDTNIMKIRQKRIRHNESLTEEQAIVLLDQLTEAENNIHKERVKLITQLKQIIPAKKIILLKMAEEQFKRKMLDQFRRHRKERVKQKN